MNFDDLSGNPDSEHPTQIAEQLEELAKRLTDDAFKVTWEKFTEDGDGPLQPGYSCPCCAQALFADAAVFLRAFAKTAEGQECEADD